MARLFSSARGADDGDGSVLSTTSILSWHTMKKKTGMLFGRRKGGGQVPGTVVKKKGKAKEEPSGLLPSLKEDAEEAEEARDPEPSPLEAQQRILHDEVAELRTSIDMLIQKARPPARELPPGAKKDDAKKSPSPVMFKPPAYGVVHVTLSKPLGLVLEQMRDPRSGRQRGARVRQIPAYGAADMSKMLEVGDELVSINGEKMIRLKFRDIMDFIVEEDDEDMELVFRRPLRDGGEEEEEEDFPSKGMSFDKQEKEGEVEHERVVSFQEESTEGQRDIGKSSKKIDVLEEPTQRESRDLRSKRRQGDLASYEETAPPEEAPPEEAPPKEAPPKEAIPEESLQPEGDIAYEDELHRLYSVSDEEESIALSVQEAMDIDNDLWSRGSDDRRAHDKREKRREKKKSRSERKSKRSSRSAEAEGPAEDRMEKFDDFVESLGLPCCSDTSEFRSQADIYEGQDIVLDEMPQG